MTEEQLRELFKATNTEEPLCGGWPGLHRYGQAVAEAERERCAKIVESWSCGGTVNAASLCMYAALEIREGK